MKNQCIIDVEAQTGIFRLILTRRQRLYVKRTQLGLTSMNYNENTSPVS